MGPSHGKSLSRAMAFLGGGCHFHLLSPFRSFHNLRLLRSLRPLRSLRLHRYHYNEMKIFFKKPCQILQECVTLRR